MGTIRAFAAAVILSVCVAGTVAAQAVAAVTGPREKAAEPGAKGVPAPDFAVAAATRARVVIAGITAAQTSDQRRSVDAALAKLVAALELVGDGAKFRAAIETGYEPARKEMIAHVAGEAHERAVESTEVSFTEPASPLVFVFGGSYFTGGGKRGGSLTVGSNVLGKVAGAVFDAIGSDGLKSYFAKNVAIGTGVPLSSNTKFTLVAEFGLGNYPVKGGRIRMSPSILLEQLDKKDVRLPTSRSADTTSKTWTSPAFGFAFTRQVKDPVWIATVAVRVPQYYPGSPADALGAMFSDKRNDFVGDGTAALVLGFAWRFRP